MLSFLKRLRVKEQTSFPKKFEMSLLKRQQLLADAIQKGSKRLSTKTLYFFLAGFCICFGTAFIGIAVTAIKDNHSVVSRNPEGIVQPRVVPIEKDYINMQRQWKYIHNLKELQDSLKKRR